MSRKWIAFLVIAVILHSVCAHPETNDEKWEAYKRDHLIDARNICRDACAEDRCKKVCLVGKMRDCGFLHCEA
ncbi:hypothetical protein OSTOST_13377 [Ostertagia ostertagi]